MYTQSSGKWSRHFGVTLGLIYPQKLFAELPEKMRERSSSLQAAVPASRKRPQPSSDNAGMQDNISSPNIKHVMDHVDIQGPTRARKFPHGLLGEVNKRNSMPSSGINPSSNVGDMDGLLHLVPQGPISYGTPSSTSPGQAPGLFAQQLGEPNVPNLRAVMFPSDNPFAYPNQPMSTLEGTQYMSPEEQENFSAGASEPEYHMTNQINANMPPELSFNDLNNSVYTNNLTQQFHSRRDFSGPMGATNYPVSSVEDTMGMTGMANTRDEFWSQMNRQGMRTGMTPGAVNLDELFGGDGWANVWNEQSFSQP
jgi:hypothetical protein